MRFSSLARLAALVFAVCWYPAQAQALIVLQSELRTTFSDIDSAQVLSAYTYDSLGNRVARTVFDGPSSAAPRMSAASYRYSANAKLIEELVTVGADTITLTLHSRNAHGDLVCSRTYGPGLALRFRDSCVYVAGRLIQTMRYTGSDVSPLFYHKYSYDITNSFKTSDTLFEASGGVFSPTQVLMLAYALDGRVSSESSWRRSGQTWFQMATTTMAYSSSKLIAVTTRNGSSVSGAYTDSTVYAYDADGNRVMESSFNDEAVLMQRVAFSWIEIAVVRVVAPLVARVIPRQPAGAAHLVFDLAGRSVGNASTARLMLVGLRDGSARLASPRYSSRRIYN